MCCVVLYSSLLNLLNSVHNASITGLYQVKHLSISHNIQQNNKNSCIDTNVHIVIWSNQHVLLSETRCETPSQLDNGYTEYDNVTVGSSVKYQCLDGYSLDGEHIAECTGNGIWSYPTPVCKRVCLFKSYIPIFVQCKHLLNVHMTPRIVFVS